MSKPIFIAEIKTQSPFGFKSPHPFAALMNYAITYGDWVSVHTNALWGGDFDAISFVRKCTNKPILAKGIHGTDDDIQRAFDHGADYVLVVDRVPGLFKFDKSNILFEVSVNDAKILQPAIKDFKVVCNQRDLKSGLPKMQWDLPEYKALGAWTCQASGIKTIEDVDPQVNAFIVGEHLVSFCDTMRRSTN